MPGPRYKPVRRQWRGYSLLNRPKQRSRLLILIAPAKVGHADLEVLRHTVKNALVCARPAPYDGRDGCALRMTVPSVSVRS